MGIVLANALLVDLDPPNVEAGSLRIDGGQIVARGRAEIESGDETLDCGGAVVLPGLVNGHTHLYSSLAAGMPAPPHAPRNFLEILQLIWWRLDRALDLESIETSATIGAIDALHHGTTTLIDHHSSPNAIDGSLDAIEQSLSAAGVRGVLCYETTDRNGRHGRDAGIEENRRYLNKCDLRRDGHFAGLAGAHASFTLNDDTLAAVAALAKQFNTGVHIHVAEGPCDERACRVDHKIALIDRLESHGLLNPASIFAHGTHLDDRAIDRINSAGVTMAHNPRSNMNNAVGYAPIGKLSCPAMLGTDGIGSDLFAEAKLAWFKSRDGHAGLSPNHILKLLATSARRASISLGVQLGTLRPGAAADVVITDYTPFTPLSADNLAGHFLFAIDAGHVIHVMIDGRWQMRDCIVLGLDEEAARQHAVAIASQLWNRMHLA